MIAKPLDDVLKQFTIRKEVMKPGRDVYVVDPAKIREVMSNLRSSYADSIYLATIVCNDKIKEGVFELNYFVHITSLGKTVVIKTAIPRSNPRISTITDIFHGAYSAELEIYDLFGVEFAGNKHLRRGFLVASDIVAQGVYPLRKDSQV